MSAIIFLNSFLTGSSQTFAPPTITSANYLQWCEARHLVGLNDGDAVDTFTDVSGAGNNWTQSNGSFKPIYKASIANGKPILRFDGADDYMTLASDILSGKSSGEVFVVAKVDNDPPAASAQSGFWKMDGDGTNACHHPFTSGDIYEAWGRNARINIGNPTPSLAAFRLYNVVSAAASYTVYLDGAQLYTQASNTFSSFGATRYLGRSVSLFGDVYFDGDWAAIVIVDAALNSTDRGAIKTNLATTYGLTVV